MLGSPLQDDQTVEDRSRNTLKSRGDLAPNRIITDEFWGSLVLNASTL